MNRHISGSMLLNKRKRIALKEKYKTFDIDTYWDRLEQHCTKDLGVAQTQNFKMQLQHTK